MVLILQTEMDVAVGLHVQVHVRDILRTCGGIINKHHHIISLEHEYVVQVLVVVLVANSS
jgi:hypothetical protein